MQSKKVIIVGAGLAGSEAAWQLAQRRRPRVHRHLEGTVLAVLLDRKLDALAPAVGQGPRGHPEPALLLFGQVAGFRGAVTTHADNPGTVVLLDDVRVLLHRQGRVGRDDLIAILFRRCKGTLLAPEHAVTEMLAVDHAPALDRHQPTMRPARFVINTTDSISTASAHRPPPIDAAATIAAQRWFRPNWAEL